MTLKIFKSEKKLLTTVHYYFFIISSVFLLMNLYLMSQLNKKEKIDDLIKELTPTHIIQKKFNTIDIIGFDVLDIDKNIKTSSKFIFYSGSQFYILLYCKRKNSEEISSEVTKLSSCKAALEHQKGGYFWSLKTTYFSGKNIIKETPEEWKIGGIYKIQFTFKIPKFTLPGKYKLIIVNEKLGIPNVGRLRTLDRIKIDIKTTKTPKNEKIGEYDLPLGTCLLNPAIQQRKQIIFPLTGDIEFFIDKDLRNFRKIIITAMGSPAFGVYPFLKIFVHQEEIGGVYVNKDWMQYVFELKLDKESHVLKIRYDNDAKGGKENRNMYVRKIKLVK